jgi:acyl-CoA:acyl-CoA alkyltransferase
VQRAPGPAARVAGLAYALPAAFETIADVESRIANAGRLPIPRGALGAISGIRRRPVVGDGEYASTLAASAGELALADAGVARDSVDLLIFASTSQDQIEPATAHIVADAMGIRGAAAFDVKNACNSFLDGMRVAEAMIATGRYRRALVVTGETPTLAARYAVRNLRELRHSFIGYTVGDAGGAVVLEPSDDERGIFYRHLWSASQHWPISQVPGGGSRYPRGDEWMYAGGDGMAMIAAARAFDDDVALRVYRETDTTPDDYARFFVHQITMPFAEELVRRLGFPRDRVEFTVADYGNVASATLPLGLALARDGGRVRRGDRVLFVGIGAGISVATMALTL